jgi:prophage regulatory protein
MAQTRIIRLKEVIRRVGLCRSSIYEYIRAGRFPRQIALGGRAVGWIEFDIDQWIDGRTNGGAL